MLAEFLKTWRSLTEVAQDGAAECGEREMRGGLLNLLSTAHSQRYRAEADEWERLASQVSLIPDRQYFLAYARELRDKADGLESQTAKVSGDGR